MRQPPPIRGRSAASNPPNPFVPIVVERDRASLSPEEQQGAAVPTRYYRDAARSIVTENDSPDIGFRYSVNPYRGCSHGCAYCYARTGHEFLGLGAGLDFETRIFVKQDGPQLLRRFLQRPSWHAEPIAFSGVTDCYQPAERIFRLTRGCLEVMREFRHPVEIITKNGLIERDLDLLAELARDQLVRVWMSLTTLDPELSRRMEPQATAPAGRLRALRQLAEAGVGTGVVLGPVIPGLNEAEVPALLEQAAAAGAQTAAYTLLRLPGSVRAVFLDWLRRERPEREGRVLAGLRDMRSGRLSDSRFGHRMRGAGPRGQQLDRLFRVFAKRLGLDRPLAPLDTSRFRRPGSQQFLFGPGGGDVQRSSPPSR